MGREVEIISHKKPNRISEQNYCTYCQYRVRKDNKTICEEYGEHITTSMPKCWLLEPFRKYKEVKKKAT